MSSSFLPLNAKQDVRPGTRNPGTFVSTLINSSVIPSLKYSSFLSALMFTNGSTATDLLGAGRDVSESRPYLWLHELIYEQTGRDDSQRDSYGNNLSPGPSLDRFVRLNLGLAFDSFGCNLKRPGKNQCNRKAKHDDDNKCLHHPWRCVEGWEENRRRLNQQPGDDCIRDRDLVNIAPLQFGEEID